MPNWTKSDLANYENRRVSQSSVTKPIIRHESLAEEKGKGINTKCHAVSIVSYRKRLLDTDNLFGGTKYFIDSLRYAGLIFDDTEAKISLQIQQVKVKENERTEIEIITL